jgi:chromosome segregation ATPase
LQAELDTANTATDTLRAERDEQEEQIKAQERQLKTASKARDALESKLEEMAEVEEERDDLLSANKGQLKRISSLLKDLEELEESAANTGELDEARELNTRLQADLDEVTEQRDAQSADLDALEQDLQKQADEGEEALKGAQDTIEALRENLATLEEDCETLRAQNAELEEKQASVGSDLADRSRSESMAQAVQSLVDDVNDRISAFRNNFETVGFCLEDIHSGVDVDDNHVAAREVLEQTGEELESIKQAIRTFRRKYQG